VVVLCLGAEGASYAHQAAQGRFLMQQGRVKDGVAALRLAVDTPEGRRDGAILELLARGALQLGDVGLAIDSARSAASVMGNLASPELLAFAEELQRRFGKVLVLGGGEEGAWVPEPAAPVLDPEWKRLYQLGLTRMKAREGGSTAVWLPVGAYRVGGQVVVVEGGTTTRMDLRREIGQQGVVFGERRTGPRTAPTVPVEGRFRLGLGGGAYGQQGDGGGVGGVRLGAQLAIGQRVVLQPWGAVDVLLIERLRGATAPPAVALGGGLEGGADGEPREGLHVGPRLGFALQWAHPIDASLPAGYAGPLQYLRFGPDLGIELRRAMGEGPEVGFQLRVSFREHRPLDPPVGSDPRPHWSLGAGVELGLAWGAP
jgi:hypothetical protein